VVAESTERTQAAGTAEAVPAVLVEGVTKTYPGVVALEDVSLRIEPGEIRGLVGENGSGKSTLVKLLSGGVSPDAGGRIELFGKPLPYGNPVATQRLGTATVHQELLVFPLLTALENVFVGDYRTSGPLTSRRLMLAEFRDLCARLEIDIDPDVPAGELSVADQTMIELLRATRREARLLLLDEPTASLGPVEREHLYALLGRLHREWGLTIVYISHDLDEVLRLTSAITVFRDGRHIRSAPTAEWSKQSMVSAMLGEAATARLGRLLVDESAPAAPAEEGDAARRHRRTVVGPPLLEVRGLTVPGVLSDVSLDVRAGEILGIAGLVGAGRTELLKALAGALKVAEGELRIEGKPVRWPTSVPRALRLGIALLPEERKTEGLVLDMPVWDNVVSTDLGWLARLGFLFQRRGKARSATLLQTLAFRGRNDAPARSLSGGNQQKVVIAKWLHRPPRVFLLDEPTRGIDVGAKAEVLSTLDRLTDRGQAIVVVSSEFEEIVAVSDRVVLLARGRVIGELTPPSITVHEILHRLFDVETELSSAEAGAA
jgi:ABC-type sugar transport system ATPase subunit